MAKLAVHPLALAFNIFGLLVWVIALGGTAGATYSCQTTNSYEYCAKTYQWEWWNLWFEFALLLALFITSFIDQAFKRGRLVFLAFFVMVTQGIMWSAHDFITSLVIGPINLRDIGQDAANAATAGFVLLGMTNFVLIIVLGKDFGYDAAASNSYQQTSSAAIQFQTSAPV